MAIAMQGGFFPNGTLWGAFRQRPQKESLCFKELQGLLVSGTMGTIAGGSQHPVCQLPITINQVGDITQREKIFLYVFYSRFHASLFLRILWMPGRDNKTICFCIFQIDN